MVGQRRGQLVVVHPGDVARGAAAGKRARLGEDPRVEILRRLFLAAATVAAAAAAAAARFEPLAHAQPLAPPHVQRAPQQLPDRVKQPCVLLCPRRPRRRRRRRGLVTSRRRRRRAGSRGGQAAERRGVGRGDRERRGGAAEVVRRRPKRRKLPVDDDDGGVTIDVAITAVITAAITIGHEHVGGMQVVVDEAAFAVAAAAPLVKERARRGDGRHRARVAPQRARVGVELRQPAVGGVAGVKRAAHHDAHVRLDDFGVGKLAGRLERVRLAAERRRRRRGKHAAEQRGEPRRQPRHHAPLAQRRQQRDVPRRRQQPRREHAARCVVVQQRRHQRGALVVGGGVGGTTGGRQRQQLVVQPAHRGRLDAHALRRQRERRPDGANKRRRLLEQDRRARARHRPGGVDDAAAQLAHRPRRFAAAAATAEQVAQRGRVLLDVRGDVAALLKQGDVLLRVIGGRLLLSTHTVAAAALAPLLLPLPSHRDEAPSAAAAPSASSNGCMHLAAVLQHCFLVL